VEPLLINVKNVMLFGVAIQNVEKEIQNRQVHQLINAHVVLATEKHPKTAVESGRGGL